jgi:hypothetical protein
LSWNIPSVDSMKSIRRTVEPLCPEANISRCYAFSFAYIFFEQVPLFNFNMPSLLQMQTFGPSLQHQHLRTPKL